MQGALAAEVALFRAWSDTYPVTERSGEWECDYRGWDNLYHAFRDYLETTPWQQWDDTSCDMLLYVIARANEFRYVIGEVAKDPGRLLYLAHQAVNSAEPDAQWQIAVALSSLMDPKSQVEALLLNFAQSQHEYVRRMALTALADVNSTHAEALATAAWETGEEYQRMVALYSLHRVGSPLLMHYLASAESDGRHYLMGYAARIQTGTAD